MTDVRRYRLASLLCLAFLAATTARGQDPAPRTGTFRVENPGHDGFHFFAHVPEGVPAKGPAPLVVILRGTGDRAERFLGDWKPFLEDYGWCGISVDSPSARPWGPDQKRGVLAAIETFARTHTIDRERVFLLGFSAGAWGASTYMLEEPGRFAAVALNGGGSYAKGRHAPGAEKTPVYAQVGEADGALEKVRVLAIELEKAGFRVRYETLPDIGHGYGPEGYRKTAEFLRDESVRVPAERALARAREALAAGRHEEVETALEAVRVALEGAAGSTDESRREFERLAREREALAAEATAAWERYLARSPVERGALEKLEAIEGQLASGDAQGAAEELDRLVDRYGDSLVASRRAARRLEEILAGGETGRAIADRLAGSRPRTLLDRAIRALERGRREQGEEILRELIESYPHTSHAARAREILSETR